MYCCLLQRGAAWKWCGWEPGWGVALLLWFVVVIVVVIQLGEDRGDFEFVYVSEAVLNCRGPLTLVVLTSRVNV